MDAKQLIFWKFYKIKVTGKNLPCSVIYFLLPWGGPLWTLKNWFFERFYIIKSNWKSSSLFLVFISSCLLLPDPSLGQMKKCTTSLYSWPYWWPYWVCFFLHLTSYNNILCISRPMVLTNAVVSNTCEGYVHLVLWLAWHCRCGVDPYERQKIDFLKGFT